MLNIPPHLAYVATLSCETLMSAKQVINNKLQGGVATYLRCGGVVNNQIKKGLLLSVRMKFFLIGEYLTKLQARAWLSHVTVLCAPGQHTARTKCTRQSHFGPPCTACRGSKNQCHESKQRVNKTGNVVGLTSILDRGQFVWLQSVTQWLN